MREHDYCRMMLQNARDAARAAGVSIPKKITALEAFGQHFVEAEGAEGLWITRGDCAWSAKAAYISYIVDKAKENQIAAAKELNYLILGIQTDGTISELFRTGNVTEAEGAFATMKKNSYTEIKLILELRVK